MRAKCGCLNVTIHLSGKIVKAKGKEVTWFLERNDIKEACEGTLSLAGVVKLYDFLATERIVQIGGSQWKVVRCLNCQKEICCSREGPGSPSLLLNSSAIITTEEQTQSILNSPNFSPIFGLLLSDRSIDPSILLTTPSPDPGNRTETLLYQNLQTKVARFIDEETEAMNERIEEFKRKEEEKLQKLQSQAVNDRKCLWHTLSSSTSRSPSSASAASSSSSPTPSSPPRASSLTSALSSSLSSPLPDNHTSTPPTTIPKTSTPTPISKTKTTSLNSRSLNFSSRAKQEQKTEQKENRRQGGIREETRGGMAMRGVGVEVDPNDPFGNEFLPGSFEDNRSWAEDPHWEDDKASSSVPVSIPGRFSAWSVQSSEKKTAKRKMVRAPHELVDAQDQEELYSGAPKSRTRTRTLEKVHM